MSLLVLAATLARAADPTLPIERESWCYPSGLRILFERTPGRASVSLVTVVDGGSSGGPVAQAGVAHLVEHLWFRTPEMEALEISTGASLNASTTWDETRYTSTANRRFVRALLAAEVARLRDPLAGVSAEVLATEREIVRNELRQRFEDNAGRGLLQLFSRLFPVTTILDAWGAAAQGVDPNVLAAEKLAAAKRSALRWQTTWALLGWMEAAVNQGAPTTAIQGVAERLAAVTPTGLADRLQGCAGAEAVTVVGDADRARASLTEAGIALAAAQAAAP